MCDQELLYDVINKINLAIDRILKRAETVHSVSDFLDTSNGVERMESICMLLIAIGESVKRLDKMTDKKLLNKYPEIDWRGVMGMRDIIAHHYFDIDAEIIFEVVKHRLPELKRVIDDMLKLKKIN